MERLAQQGGIVVTGISVCGLVVVHLLGAADAAAPSPTPAHAPWIAAMRAGLLLLALAMALRARPTGRWKAAVVGARAMLIASLALDGLSALSALSAADPACCVDGASSGRTGWHAAWHELEQGVQLRLGPLDDVQRRMFRLAAMAARAVPLLVLLAAATWSDRPAPVPVHASASTSASAWARVRHALVRWQPQLLAVGVTTLPVILAASALIEHEIAWLLPIGADTTLLGCVAAALRAHDDGDIRARTGWTLVAGSMGVGLILGTWSFGGPLPTPDAIGAYTSWTRTLIRDLHIESLVLGVLAVATSPSLQPSRDPR